MGSIRKLWEIIEDSIITDSAILNKWKFFSGMVDKWHGLPEDSIISHNFLIEPIWEQFISH